MPEALPVLIIEDEPRTAELVALYLERDGFAPHIAQDGQTGLDQLVSLQPALVILDLMLPRIDGMEVCRRIRKASNVPILMLTARDREQDRINGLSAGADDYVVKPFSPGEVVARVHAILRRYAASPPVADDTPPLTHDSLVLTPATRRVARDGDEIELTPSEFTLLQALMRSPGKVLSREELIAALYPGGEDVVPRVVDVHMGELRGKIEPDRSNPRFIRTVRGVGYRLAPREDADE